MIPNVFLTDWCCRWNLDSFQFNYDQKYERWSWNLEKCVKTRVVQNSIIYNFCFLRFFIRRSSFYIHVTHHPDYQTWHDGQLVDGTLNHFCRDTLGNNHESRSKFGNKFENKTCWEYDSLHFSFFLLFDFGTDMSRISVVSAHFRRGIYIFAQLWTFLKQFSRVIRNLQTRVIYYWKPTWIDLVRSGSVKSW